MTLSLPAALSGETETAAAPVNHNTVYGQTSDAGDAAEIVEPDAGIVTSSTPANADAAEPNAPISFFSALSSKATAIFTNPNTYIVFWAAGAMLCMTWFVYGYLRFGKILRVTGKAPDEASMKVFRELCDNGRIRLLCSEYVKTPMLVGLFRPALVIPVQKFDTEKLRDIVRHELTHYRRHDLAYKWFAMLATSLHWFNPVMFIVRRQISRACELSCDEAVIKSLSPAAKQHYGTTLLSLAATESLPIGILATTMCEGKNQLKERLVSIMDHKKTTVSAAALSLALFLLLTGCAAIGGVVSNAESTSSSSIGVVSTAEIHIFVLRRRRCGDLRLRRA